MQDDECLLVSWFCPNHDSHTKHVSDRMANTLWNALKTLCTMQYVPYRACVCMYILVCWQRRMLWCMPHKRNCTGMIHTVTYNAMLCCVRPSNTTLHCARLGCANAITYDHYDNTHTSTYTNAQTANRTDYRYQCEHRRRCQHRCPCQHKCRA